jgi:hypothetical protein
MGKPLSVSFEFFKSVMALSRVLRATRFEVWSATYRSKSTSGSSTWSKAYQVVRMLERKQTVSCSACPRQKKGTDLPDELVIKHRFRHRAVLDVLGQSRAKEVGEATDSVRAVERKRGRVVTFLRRPRSARPVRASQKLNSECSLPPPQSVKTQPKYAVCCQSREQGRCSRIGQ